MPSIKWTKESVENFLKNIGHGEITIDFSTYKSVNKKAKFTDSEYGEWWTNPGNVLHRNSRHPKRGHGAGGLKGRVGIEDVKESIKKHYGDTITIDESTYTVGRKKCRFFDKDYGEFWCYAQAITLGIRLGHPARGRKRISESRSNDAEDMYKKVEQIWGDEIKLIEYRGYNKKSLFLHREHGEWWASIYNILNGHNHPIAGKEKQKKTMVRKYGYEKPSQVRKFALKSARSTNKRIILKHWKTGEDVICTASYEYAVVNKFNELKIDYKCQIAFDLNIDEEKRVYFVDFYLPEKDIYLEVKGFLREIGSKKWEEFKKIKPNSEIWRLKDVKNFTQKTEYRITKDFKLALAQAKAKRNG